MIVLEARGLTKEFRVRSGWLTHTRRVVLRDLSLALDEGELVVLRGVSGSGKTTLLHVLAGISRPDGGYVHYRGQVLDRAAQRQVRLLYQHPTRALDPLFSARRSVAEPLCLTGIRRAEAEARAAALLSELGLAPELHTRLPEALSGGERQRVGLARALIGEPEVLLADEPTSALDEATRDDAVRLLLRMQRERRFACIVVSHEPALFTGARELVLDTFC